MILKIRVEEMKDKSGEKKRVMMATLTTNIPGMETISSVAELDVGSILGDELTELTTNMLALQKEANDKKKNEKGKDVPDNGANKKGRNTGGIRSTYFRKKT